MADRRSYGQGCPVAHALDLIGERWALLVVRELRLGARRYVDLQASLPGVGPSVLSQRLRDLERVGVIRRRRLAPPAGSYVYELTEWGTELEPVFRQLARWGMRSPVVPLAGEVSADSMMLGLRTFFGTRSDPDWTASYDVRLERDSYRIVIDKGQLISLTRGDSEGPADVRIDTNRAGWQALCSRTLSVSAAIKAGEVSIVGDTRTAQLLVDAARLD